MPLVKNIEKRIFEVEGFEVSIMYDGRDVRSDAFISVQYSGQRMTKNAATVGEFKAKFRSQFPGYDVNVLLRDGQSAPGQMLLSTVRDTYLVD